MAPRGHAEVRVYPHRIRLVGPWQAEPVGWTDPEAEERFRTDDLPPARRVKVPVTLDELGFGDRRGVIDFRRRFGVPRQLDPWERVWLVHGDFVQSDAMNFGMSWRLNGTTLDWSRPDDFDRLTTAYYPLRTDVTRLIRERNEVVVRVDAGWPRHQSTPKSFCGSAVEIGRAAYIRQVRVEPHHVAHGFGILAQVDVACEDESAPIELYALIDGHTEGYFKPARVEPIMRHLFRLDERVIAPGHTVTLRIDIVCGATIWYAAEMSVAGKQLGRRPGLNWN